MSKELFSYNIDIDKNAYLNWRTDRHDNAHNLYVLASDYADGAITLIDCILVDNRDKKADALIMPIMYSIDQSIELFLKAIIREIEELEDEVTLSDCGELASLYILLDHIPCERVVPNDDIQALLCDYMATRDLLHLNLFLTKLSGILSEVFHTCDTTEERREFEEFIDRVNSILTPTIIEGDTL